MRKEMIHLQNKTSFTISLMLLALMHGLDKNIYRTTKFDMTTPHTVSLKHKARPTDLILCKLCNFDIVFEVLSQF